nr:hypothetical protein [Tanacetum cinerariifolium]
MNEPHSSVTTWVDLTKLFFGKYYPPSLTGESIGTIANWDSTNEVFEKWLASKFTNHMMMYPFTKNALWDYYKKDDNHEVLTNDAFFDPKETYKDREHEIAEFFRIKTGIFDFKTPLCTTFNEFNYLLKIDTCLFTHDIQEAKTYKKYGNKLNNDHEELWSENERNHIHETFANTKIDANYNHYLDVSRKLNNHAGSNDEEVIREERKPNDDHGIRNFDNDLVQDSALYHTSEEEEKYKKD